MLVVDFTSPDKVRGCARFDAERVRAAEAEGKAKPGQLLGKGHLAMTIDQGPDMSRYQGLVPLEGNDLEQVAHEYFLRSEQIPTRVRLAVAEEYRGGNGARRHWRAGGILLQFLPNSTERARQADLDPGDAPPGTAVHAVPEDEAWVEGRSLVETVDDIELLDTDLSSERLAYRLFHERGVHVFNATPIEAQCSCSRHNVENMLKSFSEQDRADMIEDGHITVTCEFCSSTYVFEPDEIAAASAAASVQRPDSHWSMIFSENRKSTLGSSPRASFFRIMLKRSEAARNRQVKQRTRMRLRFLGVAQRQRIFMILLPPGHIFLMALVKH
jgi:molecular chaperone Hsp33